MSKGKAAKVISGAGGDSDDTDEQLANVTKGLKGLSTKEKKKSKSDSQKKSKSKKKKEEQQGKIE
jgi:hypothetical protein